MRSYHARILIDVNLGTNDEQKAEEILDGFSEEIEEHISFYALGAEIVSKNMICCPTDTEFLATFALPEES